MFTLDLAAFSPGEILCFSIRGIRDIRWSSTNFSFFCGLRPKNSGEDSEGGIDKLGDFLQKEELRTCPRNQEDSHLRVGFSFANGFLSGSRST
jgi:hypothetical protein